MKLMSVEEFANTVYTTQSRPTNRTIIKRIVDGTIPGKLDGNRYVIDIDAYMQLTGNPLVDNVIFSPYTK